MRYWHEQTRGFYDTAVHATIPDGAIELTDEQYEALLADQAAGKVIQVVDGAAVAADREFSDEELWAFARDQRNAELAASDWTQLPDAPLSDEEKQQWRDYRQELRDIPQTQADAGSIAWPSKPEDSNDEQGGN